MIRTRLLPLVVALLLLALLILPARVVGGALPWAALPFLAMVLLGTVALERFGSRAAVAGLVLAAIAGALTVAGSALAAAMLLATYGAALLASARGLAGRTRWLALPLVAAAGGAVPALLWQLGNHFSDEEFQVALVALVMGGALALTLLLFGSIRPQTRAPGWRPLLLLALLLPATLGVIAFLRYPTSFYGSEAPGYPGISAQRPFLCAELPEHEQLPPTASGSALFEQVVAGVVAREPKDAADLGWLALATDDEGWALAFRAALLDEAATGRYTEPANSIKYHQRDAAARATSYALLRHQRPDLFSAADQAQLAAWFAAINRRAMTVEWVDLLYGSAFGSWQVGPYANQEIGNGLIATLRATGLEDPTLAAANAAYLAPGKTGWLWRWRNSDDTYEYQRVWIDSAFAQQAEQGDAAGEPAYANRRRLAFEWLLLQMLPDGSTPAYNNPGGTLPPYGTLLLGARLTGDGRYLTAAARMLAFYERSGHPLYEQIGLSQPPDVAPEPLRTGSCLMYGESGIPTEAGPLAPDKIVMRDGWEDADQYLLLNLRFAGWHRYKGTNSVSVIAAGGQTVLSDVPTGTLWPWVPAGRQKFRDKRIARSQTNGLQLPATGMAAALHALTGLGEGWAQDPPPYVSVGRFTTLPGWDSSVTGIEGWNGWSHARTIHFLHGGPIVILDEAAGGGQRAAISWNSELPIRAEEGYWALGDARLYSMPLLPMEARVSGQQLLVQSREPGRLAHVTLFLPPAWADAQVHSQPSADGRAVALTLQHGAEQVTLLLNRDPGRMVSADRLQSDAEALLLRGEGLCAVGGTQAVIAGQGMALPAGNGCVPLERR